MKVVLIGASGLIGSKLLSYLEKDNTIKEIVLGVRTKMILENKKTNQIILDFSDNQAIKELVKGSDVVFCTIGTTKKKTNGNSKLYRKVDFEIPLNFAKIASKIGVKNFILVSSVGANPNSNSFYLNLKGEVEKEISKLSFNSIHFFRPSMLLGDRREFRLGELVGKKIMNVFSFLIPINYKPIQAKIVAKAMLTAFKSNYKGIKIHHYNDMIKS